MKILSIDVGTINLAQCLFDWDSKKILHWECEGIPPEHSSGIFPSLRDHLDNRPWIEDADVVLIEKQPGFNKRMKSVENFLQAYFVIKYPDKETFLWDARLKLAGDGDTYRKRKKLSIERTREFLMNDENNMEWRDLFKSSKKKDDLADTVLQSLSWREKPGCAAPKVPKARRPTEHQRETRYSRSNLVWLLKATPDAELVDNKRFMKDLKRYYVNLEELKQLLEI